MKKYLRPLSFAALLGMGLSNTAAFTQGLVIFANGPTTLISSGPPGAAAAFPAGPVGAYYFALLTAPTAAGPFSFTGVYATNTTAAGRFGSASYTPAVPGWAPGATMFYEVAGWSAVMGTAFNPAWITNYMTWSPTQSLHGYFGVSAIASGVAGGIAPQAKLSASISGGSIVVFWTPTGGILQFSTSLGAGETWSTVGEANPASIPISGSAMFVRVVPVVYPTLDLFGASGLQGFDLLPPPI